MRSGVGAEPTETRTGSVSNFLFSAFLVLNSSPQGQSHSADRDDLSACVTLYRPRCWTTRWAGNVSMAARTCGSTTQEQTTQTETITANECL